MADPVSVVGTAVGVVSLGLQVYGGLKQYLHDLNSRNTRVAKTLAYLEQLKATLDAIGTASQSLRTQHQAPADAVLSCLHSCSTEMRDLQRKLQETQPSQQISVKGKMKEFKKKFEYPFHISTLEEMGENLKRITDQLLLGAQGLGLYSHLTINTNLDALNDTIKIQESVLAKLSADSDASQKLNSSNTTQLTSIDLSVQPLQSMLLTLESVTKDRFDKFEDRVHTNHSANTARLDILESRTEANTRTMTEVLNILQHLSSQSPPMNRESAGRHLVGALVSRPSLLEAIHELRDFHPCRNSPSNNTRRLRTTSGWIASENSRFCHCHPWRKIEKKKSRWYPFDFFSERETESTHSPGCLNYVDISVQRRQTIGFTYYGLQKLLSAAVSVSMSLDYGAGGTSISPVFRCYSVVDTSQSAPFRMLALLFQHAETLRPMFSRAERQRKSIMQSLVADCVSGIRMAYNKRIASPRDVSSDGLTLIDYIVKKFHFDPSLFFHVITELSNLGVTSTQQQPLVQIFTLNFLTNPSFRTHQLLASLLLRKAPECQYQWNTPDELVERINFLQLGDFINQSNEISTALELNPLCFVLLRQDLDGLSSDILATKPKLCAGPNSSRQTTALTQLAVRWPVGLNHILETIPDFFNPPEFESLFDAAVLFSYYQCPSDMCNIYKGCGCSKPMETLLRHDSPLTSKNIEYIFSAKASRNTCYVVLKHLKEWRQKLRGLSAPINQQDQPIAHEPDLLDHEAPYVVKKLQALGRDPYEIFRLQRGDYRLGPSLHGGNSIYHVIKIPERAQMAFDLGFRDVDSISGGITPLSKNIKCGSLFERRQYCEWLVAHGADYTRELAWATEGLIPQPASIEYPKYYIIHGIFRWILPACCDPNCLDQDDLASCVLSVVRSPSFPRLTKSICYDGCSCACSSSPKGCSLSVLYFNQMLWWHSEEIEKDPGFFGDVVHIFDLLTGIVEPPLKLAESAIRCLTFDRLEIRHTCCSSITDDELPADYGSDFDELREEDECRVHRLDDLVTSFMSQYKDSTLSLRDFLIGPWVAQMGRIKAEEKNMAWTAQEKDALLSIGVLPKDELIDDDDDESEGNEEDDESEGNEEDDERLHLEYWSRQFEIIANGGRSREEWIYW
ncbi:hypothetical protein F5Y10DRAFT_244983 [Nemania abortiva]|nr:hypothetical protein F5Y10DRAFT_244983 [Nemania abortiva]